MTVANTYEFSNYQKLIDEGHELPLDDPAFQRKLRSEEQLQRLGVPTLAWLPMIVNEANAAIRPAREISQRAVCLMVVALKAEAVRDGWWDGDFALTAPAVLESYGCQSALTPAERAYLDDPTPTELTNAQFGWRYEALSTLLWAIGYNHDLPWPTGLCDVAHDCGVVKQLGPEGFFSQANLRGTGEILDAADHIYRLHWAVRQARTNGTFPAPQVVAGVVMERHHTLNWLIGYGDQQWDDVGTDT